MDKYFQIVLLSTIACQAYAQNFYSTYTNPYQNSFAFATPNLKQIFTTKLPNAPQQINQHQAQLFSPQQTDTNQQYSANQLSNFYNAYYQQQQQQQALAQQQSVQQQQNFYVNEPQQYDDALFKQQYYNTQLQQQQQQQRGAVTFEQFQAPFIPSAKDAMPVAQQAQQQEQYKSLLGVAYSPSTKVSQVKFDSSKLKYDF